MLKCCSLNYVIVSHCSVNSATFSYHSVNFEMLTVCVVIAFSYSPGLRFVQHRGSPRNFPKGGLTLPTRRLEYGFQGIVNAKNLRQTNFSPSDGG